jgi:hypothetical protein
MGPLEAGMILDILESKHKRQLITATMIGCTIGFISGVTVMLFIMASQQ